MQRGGQEHRQRVGDPLPRDVGRGAVDGLEQARGRRLAERGAGQHPERAGDHRGLVAEDVAEHVLGEDHVEVARGGDELHRALVDEHVLELDVRELLGVHAVTTSRHSRLVSSTLALSTLVTLRARGAEGDARDALDLGDGVDAQVAGAVGGARLLAEVDAAGELAHDEQVGALDDARASAGSRRSSAVDGPHRAQVRVQARALAQAEQALLGARRVGVGRVPLRAADGREQDGVGRAAGGERLVGQRGAVGVDRRAAERVLLEARSRRARAGPRASGR